MHPPGYASDGEITKKWQAAYAQSVTVGDSYLCPIKEKNSLASFEKTASKISESKPATLPPHTHLNTNL